MALLQGRDFHHRSDRFAFGNHKAGLQPLSVGRKKRGGVLGAWDQIEGRVPIFNGIRKIFQRGQQQFIVCELIERMEFHDRRKPLPEKDPLAKHVGDQTVAVKKLPRDPIHLCGIS